MLQNMKLATRFGLGFGMIAILLLTLSFVSLSRIKGLNNGMKTIMGDRYPHVALVNDAARLSFDTSRQVSNMLLASSDEERESAKKNADSARLKLAGDVEKLGKFLASKKETQLFRDISDKYDLLNLKYGEFYALVKSDQKKAIEFNKADLDAANSAFRSALDAVDAFQSDAMDKTAEETNQTYLETRRLIITISCIAMALAFVIAASMALMADQPPQMATELNGNAGQLAAAEPISATAQSLPQTSNEQTAETDSMAAKVSQEAMAEGDAIKCTVSTMKQIAIIDDIAYHSNLLALNAAIETTRAGENGKGFALVTAQARKLAARSQAAAQEIVEAATNSAELAERAGVLLDSMTPKIKRMADAV